MKTAIQQNVLLLSCCAFLMCVGAYVVVFYHVLPKYRYDASVRIHAVVTNACAARLPDRKQMDGLIKYMNGQLEIEQGLRHAIDGCAFSMIMFGALCASVGYRKKAERKEQQ